MAEIISLQVHERAKKMPTPQKSLPSYGEHGSIAKTLLSEATLGYYLGQLDAEDLAILSSRNQDSADLLFKRKKKDPNIQGVKTILQKAGKEIQKGNISYGSVINHLADIDLALKNGDTFFSSDLASGIWRWSKHLADKKRRNVSLGITTSIFTTMALAGGMVALAKDSHKETPLPQSTQSPTDIATFTPDITNTPEPSLTPEAENRMALEWNNLIKKYKTDQLSLNGGTIIHDSNLNNPIGFRNDASVFLEKYDMFNGTDQIIFDHGLASETDLVIEKKGDETVIRIDGRHTLGINEPNAFSYNSKTGKCTASHIDFDLNVTVLDSNESSQTNETACFAMAYTSASQRIVIKFQPKSGGVDIQAAIFEAPLK